MTETEVLPAYRAYARFMKDTYVPPARHSIGLIGLPDGERRYQQKIREQTTTNLTAGDIHEVSLQEVKRIEMQLAQLAAKSGYPDLQSFQSALNHDPRYIPSSPEQIVDDFRGYVEKMTPRLPELFYR